MRVSRQHLLFREKYRHLKYDSTVQGRSQTILNPTGLGRLLPPHTFTLHSDWFGEPCRDILGHGNLNIAMKQPVDLQPEILDSQSVSM